MDELFAPPAYEWSRLSPQYRSLRRLTTLLVIPMLFSVPAILVGALTGRWEISALMWGIAAVLVVLRLLLVERNWRSWGYVEREDDLYITHGVLFRTLVAVPYGRMQLVEVESGPLERAFGLASVSLHTASASTDATIPGLNPQEAARLRDRLTDLGEARASGL
ncbi:MAG TPA: PH domain-containing protein [Propionibacteriaceae bacterium]|nr:PH domain-containing protein [Propionibacteriaceae bacterium]